MDKTVKFETYSRVVPALLYDGTLDSFGKLNEFTGNKLHLRFGTEPVFMSEFGLVQIAKGDWIVEIAEGRFVPMKEATRRAVFCPFNEGLPKDHPEYVAALQADDHAVDAAAFAFEHFRDMQRFPATVAQETINTLGMDFARDDGSYSSPTSESGVHTPLYDEPVVPRREPQDPYLRVFGVDSAAADQGDYTAIMIKPDHPHHQLINSILSMTGVDAAIKQTPLKEAGALATNQPYEVALVAMKLGYRVDRGLWDGRAWLCLGEGRECHPGQFWNARTKAFAQARADAAHTSDQATTHVGPYINAVDVQRGTVHMGYNLDADDQFANDWRILEN